MPRMLKKTKKSDKIDEKEFERKQAEKKNE